MRWTTVDLVTRSCSRYAVFSQLLIFLRPEIDSPHVQNLHLHIGGFNILTMNCVAVRGRSFVLKLLSCSYRPSAKFELSLDQIGRGIKKLNF